MSMENLLNAQMTLVQNHGRTDMVEAILRDANELRELGDGLYDSQMVRTAERIISRLS